MTIHRPAANTGPTVVEPVLAAAMNRQVNDAIASVRDIRWVCHTAIIDGPRSRRHAGLQTFVWTSHQSTSQPMLPTIEALSMDVRKTVVNSFVISRVDYCNGLLAGVPRYQLDRLQSVMNHNEVYAFITSYTS